MVDVDGQVVASGGLVIHDAPPTVKNPLGLEEYVMSVFTLQNGAIMQSILAYLRENQITMVTLRASDQGRPFYTRLGFEATNNTMRMYLE